MKKNKKILISACLIGVRCRYDNKFKPCRAAMTLYKNSNVIPICPEQLGGLSTPRCASGILTGNGLDVLLGKSKVINERKENVTKQFIEGAKEALRIAKMSNVDKFIAKSDSPSCGLGTTLKAGFINGIFSKKCVKGDGVTIALFKKNGIAVITEKEI